MSNHEDLVFGEANLLSISEPMFLFFCAFCLFTNVLESSYKKRKYFLLYVSACIVHIIKHVSNPNLCVETRWSNVPWAHKLMA